MKIMLKSLFFIFVLINVSSFAQVKDFQLEYSVIGLGSNLFSNIYPKFQVEGNQMNYTVADNHWRKTEGNESGDSVFVYGEKTMQIELRWSSVDSIIQIVNEITDTLIVQSNFMMSGGIHMMKVRIGQRRVTFQMYNTFDRAALKITDITNQYVPEQYRTWVTLEDVIEDEKLWESLYILPEEIDSLIKKE